MNSLRLYASFWFDPQISSVASAAYPSGLLSWRCYSRRVILLCAPLINSTADEGIHAEGFLDVLYVFTIHHVDRALARAAEEVLQRANSSIRPCVLARRLVEGDMLLVRFAPAPLETERNTAIANTTTKRSGSRAALYSNRPYLVRSLLQPETTPTIIRKAFVA